MELSTYISANIKRLRTIKNLSQKEVAMSIDKKSNLADEDINLSILEKVKLIDTLEKDEKN